MRSNKNIEFKYSKVTNKNNPAGTGNPVTSLTGINDAGHNVVTMYTEKTWVIGFMNLDMEGK